MYPSKAFSTDLQWDFSSGVSAIVPYSPNDGVTSTSLFRIIHLEMHY